MPFFVLLLQARPISTSGILIFATHQESKARMFVNGISPHLTSFLNLPPTCVQRFPIPKSLNNLVFTFEQGHNEGKTHQKIVNLCAQLTNDPRTRNGKKKDDHINPIQTQWREK